MQDSVLPRDVGLRKPHITPYITSFSLLLTSFSTLLTSFYLLLTLFPLPINNRSVWGEKRMKKLKKGVANEISSVI